MLALGATQAPWFAGADATQATVSVALADAAIAAKHVSSAAVAAAFPQAHDERGETPGCPTDKPLLTFAHLQYGLSADGLQNSAATLPHMTSHAFLRSIATLMLLVFCVLEIRSDLMTQQTFGARQSLVMHSGSRCTVAMLKSIAVSHCMGPQSPVLLQVHPVSVPS